MRVGHPRQHGPRDGASAVQGDAELRGTGSDCRRLMSYVSETGVAASRQSARSQFHDAHARRVAGITVASVWSTVSFVE